MKNLIAAALLVTSLSAVALGQNSNPVVLQGVLEPVEKIRLATRDPGIVAKVPVKEGQKVSAGQAIVILDSKMFAAELEAARREFDIATQQAENEVDLKYAKISAEVNEKVLDRSRQANLQFPKTVSGTEIERLRLEYERARLSGEQAEMTQRVNRLTRELRFEQVKVAQTRLEYRQVKSEIDGVVVELLNSPGEFVQAGTTIARIINLDRLRVKCVCPIRDIKPSEISDEAIFEFSDQGKAKLISARITFVSPEIDPVRQTFSVWAEIENSSGVLFSGATGNLKLKRK